MRLRAVVVVVGLIILWPVACKERQEPSRPIMSGTYEHHDSAHLLMLTFLDDRHMKFDPGSDSWLYLVVGDTLLLQHDNPSIPSSMRLLIRGDSLVLTPRLVFVRAR